MAGKRKGNRVHGWVILDKPDGAGSTSMVGKVRHFFKAQKAGHGGTLDPFATGLLPIALGEATKTVAFVMDGQKTYRFTVKWGEETDSADCEGAIVARHDHRPSREDILEALPHFTGLIEQVPPVFSALKIDGQRAYDLARRGKAPEMKPRQVEIETLTLLEISKPGYASFEVTCGKGTYVRALGRDIARHLGTVGHLVRLRRTRVGPFCENHAISLAELEEMAHNPAVAAKLQPVETVLDGIPAIVLSDEEARKIRNGQAVSLIRKVDLDRIRGLVSGDTVVALAHGKAIALVSYARAEIRPIRVLIQ